MNITTTPEPRQHQKSPRRRFINRTEEAKLPKVGFRDLFCKTIKLPKTMTKPEANTLAFLRMRHGYSFSLLCQAARAIWGEDWVVENCNGRKGGDQIRGQGLLIIMEDTLGLETCKSDEMTIAQCHCRECHKTDFYITPPEDVAKECYHCGSQSTFLTR